LAESGGATGRKLFQQLETVEFNVSQYRTPPTSTVEFNVSQYRTPPTSTFYFTDNLNFDRLTTTSQEFTSLLQVSSKSI